MNQELQNALAFYQAPPQDAPSGLKAMWLWFWETLQGDFHENPSTAQVVTGTLIFMIPLVDQIGDVRDLIANCRKVSKESDDTWAWVALILTLIGLIPSLGSLLKGCFKVLFLYLRKYLFKTLKPVRRLDVSVLDQVMVLLRQHLDNPAVRKTLAWMKINNPYHYLAGKLDEVKSSLTVKELLAGLDEIMRVTREMFDSVVKWGPDSLKAPVERMWAMLVDVRGKASDGITKALEPAQNYVDQIINRLRVEGDNAYRARPGNNAHVLGSRADAELELMRREQPDWVDKVTKAKYPALEVLPPDAVNRINAGWPDISETSKHKGLENAFRTFDASLEASEILPGARLYRVVDPSSGDNSICWMREAEFQALKTKSQWRREYAVWKHWNENGEYVLYTVPPGKSLKVWEGRAGTQELKADPRYKLEGGRQQIVLNPYELDPKFVSARKRTGWSYDDGTASPDLDPIKPFLGLPDLTHKWRMPEPNKEH
ncbi:MULTISPECIES: hypothetical protein [Pseudomonas]|uniref:hypothetical protein n=1 Tax=Pseudomonas TaxID=286 RepID=UPI000CFB74CA|nr:MULTISPECIES: hypothetical protein [Pseudomonas]PQZ87283.1 hypothetical protein CQ048_20880 [Pseudomonas trivialis]PRB24313.1 hypothetical protein CQ041_20085 [Pseudomonas sp. MYb60]